MISATLKKNEFAPVSCHHTTLEDAREILNRMVRFNWNMRMHRMRPDVQHIDL